MELQQFIAYLQNEKRYSPHTIAAYQKDIQEFEQYLQTQYDSSLIKAQRKFVRSWLAKLISEQLKARSVNRKLSSLKSFYNYLQKQDVIQANPTQTIQSLKVEEKLPSFTEQKPLIQLFEHLPQRSFSELRTYLMFQLLYFTGMRRAELIQLTEADIDLTNKEIKILGKGNKVRMVPLPIQITKTLQKYLPLRKQIAEDKELLLTDAGKTMYPKFVYRVVTKTLGLVTTQAKKSPHTLRHSFASHLLNNGADLMSIKELLGHESLQATQVYTHTNIEELKKIYRKTHPSSKKIK